MKFGWLLIGVVITILIFIFIPGLFDKLVSIVKHVIGIVQSLIDGGSLNVCY